MNKTDIIAFFDSHANNWDKNLERKESVIKTILDKSEVKEGTRVLDIACGTGVLFPDYFSRKVAHVTGVDVSSEMVKLAKKKFPLTEVICADAEVYKFNNEFDVAMVYNAFPHFTSPERLIENLSFALKKGGRLTVAHGMSMKDLEMCHSQGASKVSRPLPQKEELAEMMSTVFEVDVMISDDEMYMVSGIKR